MKEAPQGMEYFFGSTCFRCIRSWSYLKLSWKWIRRISLLSGKVIMAKEKLNESCRLVQQDSGNADLFASEIFAVKYCSEMSKQRRAFFFQPKARVQWLNLGHHNMREFLETMKKRFNRNKIIALKRDDGSEVKETARVKLHSFYHNLWRFRGSTRDAFNFRRLEKQLLSDWKRKIRCAWGSQLHKLKMKKLKTINDADSKEEFKEKQD